MDVQWTAYNSPVGVLTLVECAAGPLVVEFASRVADLRWAERLRARRPAVRIGVGPCDQTTQWLDAYFSGTPQPAPWPAYLLDWMAPSPQQAAVWEALCDIPLGETRAYDDIARATGLHPRLVGQLNGANWLALRIPCHRVVGKKGDLVGYGGGLDRKRWLLAHELRSTGLVLR